MRHGRRAGCEGLAERDTGGDRWRQKCGKKTNAPWRQLRVPRPPFAPSYPPTKPGAYCQCLPSLTPASLCLSPSLSSSLPPFPSVSQLSPILIASCFPFLSNPPLVTSLLSFLLFSFLLHLFTSLPPLFPTSRPQSLPSSSLQPSPFFLPTLPLPQSADGETK